MTEYPKFNSEVTLYCPNDGKALVRSNHQPSEVKTVYRCTECAFHTVVPSYYFNEYGYFNSQYVLVALREACCAQFKLLGNSTKSEVRRLPEYQLAVLNVKMWKEVRTALNRAARKSNLKVSSAPGKENIYFFHFS